MKTPFIHFCIYLLITITSYGCGGSGSKNPSNQPVNPSPNTNLVDNQAPKILNVFPSNGFSVSQSQVWLRVNSTDNIGVTKITAKIDGKEIDLNYNASNNQFNAYLPLNPGMNTYSLSVSDKAGNTTKGEYRAYFGHRISAGNSHSGAIKNQVLYAWGRNNKGQTGIGKITKIVLDKKGRPIRNGHPIAPVKIPTPTPFISIAFNQNSSLALDKNGEVWSWGDGAYGQLGQKNLPKSKVQTTPKKLQLNKKAISITRGYNHSLVLFKDGSVGSFGMNNLGQLGNGNTANQDTLAMVQGLSDIIQIAAGANTSYALDKSGRLWGWGGNGYANLGISSKDSNAHRTPVQIPLPEEIASLAAGKGHVLALSKNGKVYGWGLNYSSQVGKFDNLRRNSQWPDPIVSPKALPLSFKQAIVAVWANGNQSFLSLDNGQIYPWGQNVLGSLGIGSDDKNIDKPENPVFGITNAIEMGNGALHSLAIEARKSKLYSWGWSFEGSLGGGRGTISRWAYRVPLFIDIK